MTTIRNFGRKCTNIGIMEQIHPQQQAQPMTMTPKAPEYQNPDLQHQHHQPPQPSHTSPTTPTNYLTNYTQNTPKIHPSAKKSTTQSINDTHGVCIRGINN